MGGGGNKTAGGFSFFYILQYYFMYVIIKTLWISNFFVMYVIYFTHSSYCCYDAFFPSPEKWHFWLQEMYLLSVFDLDG